jgi:hypothetical protein
MKFTDEEIQAMAFSAGLDSAVSTADAVLVWEGEAKHIRALVELAAKAERNRIATEAQSIIKRAEQRGAEIEREACAKAVEAEAHMFETLAAAKSLANGIRARTTP